MAKSLADRFVAHAGRVELPLAELEANLATVVSRAARSELAPPGEDFVEYLATRCPPGELATLNAADLYLAFACSRDDARAIELLHREQLADMAEVVARAYKSAALADDVRQRVAEAMLVAPAGKVRGIEQYKGKGSLRSFLRVIGMREATRISDRKNVVSDDNALFERTVGAVNEDVARMKAGYRKLFREAFTSAVASLSFHDRLLLKQHFCDELTLDEVAKLHQMHRATVARQLAKIRDKLLERTREHFKRELAVDSGDLDEIMHLIASQLDVSINRLLA